MHDFMIDDLWCKGKGKGNPLCFEMDGGRWVFHGFGVGWVLGN